MNQALLSQARATLKKARYVVTFSGAGLSAESGLATFRDTETDALWARFDPRELASRVGFEKSPERVLDWYQWRRSKYANVAPNPAHLTLARHSKLIHITQNVDNLLEQAGAMTSNVLHLHGTIMKDHCDARCGHEEEVDMHHPPSLRRCPQCNALMRPSVVWFGESLPADIWRSAEVLCGHTDCLLVVGTTRTVYPAASLVELVSNAGGQVIVINTVSEGTSDSNTIELIGKAGELLPILLDDIDVKSQ